MKALVIVEHDGTRLHPETGSVITAARKLDENPDCLVMGYQIDKIAEKAASFTGIRQVLQADDASYASLLPQLFSTLIASLASEYDVILAASTTFGKTLMPAVAAKLDVSQVTDVTAIIDGKTFEHPIYAGNAIETVEVIDDKKVLLIRGTLFEKAPFGDKVVPIKKCEIVLPSSKITFIERSIVPKNRPDLGSAQIVVSGGRALQSADKFQLIETLADKLGAAVGATRAAVDAGFAPNEYQVGQTGRIVAPHLYIAIGISGAVQHLAGMKDSNIIVAINRDPDAPIFQVADYGLVGDLFEVIPELIELLQEKT